jgi:hypothetical protein
VPAWDTAGVINEDEMSATAIVERLPHRELRDVMVPPVPW